MSVNCDGIAVCYFYAAIGQYSGIAHINDSYCWWGTGITASCWTDVVL